MSVHVSLIFASDTYDAATMCAVFTPAGNINSKCLEEVARIIKPGQSLEKHFLHSHLVQKFSTVTSETPHCNIL